MRRAIAAIVGTVTGLVLLLQYRSSPIPAAGDAGIALPSGPSVRAVATAPPNPSLTGAASVPPSPLPASTAAPVPSATRSRGTTRPPTRAPSSSPKPTLKATPKPTPARATFVGDTYSNRYGDVQVEITVSGGRITDVRALKLPNERAKSARISNNAAPQLRQEALDAQSANIDTVSGATYTSEGYRSSLQSAIDRWRA